MSKETKYINEQAAKELIKAHEEWHEAWVDDVLVTHGVVSGLHTQIKELQEEIRSKNNMIAHIYDGLDRELLSKKIYTQSEMETTARTLADSILLSSKPPAKWYENIPEQGVLCWCKEYEEDVKCKRLLERIDEYTEGRFLSRTTGFLYKTVQPLTNEEIEEFKR